MRLGNRYGNAGPLGGRLGHRSTRTIPPPLTINQEFPGAHLLLLDPYDTGGSLLVESDRVRLRDTSDARNDALHLNTPSGSSPLPFTGTTPTGATVDGNPSLSFDGSANNLAGWFTGTPTGENWFPRSESMSSDWAFTNCSAGAGPTPPPETGAAASILMTGTGASGYHYAQTQLQPPTGGWQAGQRYTMSVCFKAITVDHAMMQVDNLTWYQTVNISNGTLGGSVGPAEVHHIESLPSGWFRVWYSFTMLYTVPAAHPIIVWMLGPGGSIMWDASGGQQMAVTAPCMHPTRTLTEGCRYHVTAGSPWYASPALAATLVVVSRQTSPLTNRAVFDSIDASGGTNTGPMMGKETQRVARSFYGPASDLLYTSSNDAGLIMQVATTTGIASPDRSYFYERTTLKDNQAQINGTFFKPRLFYGVGRLINSGGILWPWLGDICFVGYWPAAKDATWIGALSTKLGFKFPSLAA